LIRAGDLEALPKEPHGGRYELDRNGEPRSTSAGALRIRGRAGTTAGWRSNERALRALRVIAGNTIASWCRNKLLYNLLFFAVLLIGRRCSWPAHHRAWTGSSSDMGLAAMELFGVLIAVLIGVAWWRERSSADHLPTLAKPVPRAGFCSGATRGSSSAGDQRGDHDRSAGAGACGPPTTPFRAGHRAAFLIFSSCRCWRRRRCSSAASPRRCWPALLAALFSSGTCSPI